LNDKPRGRSYVRKERARDARSDGIFRRPAEFIRTLLAPLVRLSGGGAAGEGSPADEPNEDRARIVVPRHERGGAGHSHLGIELREVRRGRTSRTPYLREVRSQREFTQRRTGYLEATEISSRPRGRIERVVQAIKGVVLGSPFATSRIAHERLTKVKALAIFSSDALSSSAYATEEILLILVLAGSGALKWSLPIAGVIALLIVIVTASYRQTIRAYPSGGGAYVVAHENLGRGAGLTAGAALLVDYVLTVSVSVAAGVAAVTSAVPEIHDLRVPIGVLVIALITLGNLRGIREAGTLFALPTYFFICSMGAVIMIGVVRVAIGDAPGSLTDPAPPEEQIAATQGLTLFLLMRAFSSGSAALTGIEAISNGVPAFKTPEVANARTTMTVMAGLLIFLFLGITFLTSRYGFVPSEDETIVSQLGAEVLGRNLFYYGYQVATALVLFLAANTSYNGFPPLGAILARDRFLPRQFSFRGDRLAYSNGIMLLAVAAAVLLAIFGGEVTRLIPLYALGVFVSFTLSQSGMVRHWLRFKEPGWRTSLAISALGAAATAVVAVIILGTKFTHGAWLSVLMMLALMGMFALIRRHYDWFQRKIAVDESSLPVGVPAATSIEAPREHVIVPVDGVNKIAVGAIGMAREISNRVTAVHITDDPAQAEEFAKQWERAVPDVPLLIIESPYRAFVAPVLRYLERLDEMEDQRITVILPTFVARHWWERILHNRDVLRLRPFLKDRAGVRVVDFPYRLYEDEGSRKDTQTRKE
jgi:amino acid transporter